MTEAEQARVELYRAVEQLGFWYQHSVSRSGGGGLLHTFTARVGRGRGEVREAGFDEAAAMVRFLQKTRIAIADKERIAKRRSV